MSSSKSAISSSERASSRYVTPTLQEVLDYVKLKQAGKPVESLRDYLGGIPDLRGLDLSNQNLSHGDFSDCLMMKTNVSGSNMRHAVLQGADLMGADIRQTNFSYCNMQAAKLQGCDGRTTNFSNADLRWANLLWINLVDNQTLANTDFTYAATFDDYSHARVGTRELGSKPKDLLVTLNVAKQNEVFMPYRAMRCYEDAFRTLSSEGVRFDQRFSKVVTESLADGVNILQPIKAVRQALTSLRGILPLATQGRNSEGLAEGEYGITLPVEVLLMIGEYVVGNSATPDVRKRLVDYALDRRTLTYERYDTEQSFVEQIIEGKQELASHQERVQQSRSSDAISLSSKDAPSR